MSPTAYSFQQLQASSWSGPPLRFAQQLFRLEPIHLGRSVRTAPFLPQPVSERFHVLTIGLWFGAAFELLFALFAFKLHSYRWRWHPDLLPPVPYPFAPYSAQPVRSSPRCRANTQPGPCPQRALP